MFDATQTNSSDSPYNLRSQRPKPASTTPKSATPAPAGSSYNKENTPALPLHPVPVPSAGWLRHPAWIGKVCLLLPCFCLLIFSPDGGTNPPIFYHSHEEINAALIAAGAAPSAGLDAFALQQGFPPPACIPSPVQCTAFFKSLILFLTSSVYCRSGLDWPIFNI